MSFHYAFTTESDDERMLKIHKNFGKVLVKSFVSKFLARAGGMVGPVKIFLLSSLITFSHTMCVHVGSQKVRDASPTPEINGRTNTL